MAGDVKCKKCGTVYVPKAEDYGIKCSGCGESITAESALLSVTKSYSYERGESIGCSNFEVFIVKKMDDSSERSSIVAKWLSVNRTEDENAKHKYEDMREKLASEAKAMQEINREDFGNYFPDFYEITPTLGGFRKNAKDKSKWDINYGCAIFMQRIFGDDLTKSFECRFDKKRNTGNGDEDEKTTVSLQPRCTVDEVDNIARQMYSALEVMHSKTGYFHLDIKSDNIMREHTKGSDGRYKYRLIDFGLATKDTLSCFHGTPRYRSKDALRPEFCDLHALGETMKTMLTGQEPAAPLAENGDTRTQEDIDRWVEERNREYEKVKKKNPEYRALFRVIDGCLWLGGVCAKPDVHITSAKIAVDLLLDRKYCRNAYCRAVLGNANQEKCEVCKTEQIELRAQDWSARYGNQANNTTRHYCVEQSFRNGFVIKESVEVETSPSIKIDLTDQSFLYSAVSDNTLKKFCLKDGNFDEYAFVKLQSKIYSQAVLYEGNIYLFLEDNTLATINTDSFECKYSPLPEGTTAGKTINIYKNFLLTYAKDNLFRIEKVGDILQNPTRTFLGNNSHFVGQPALAQDTGHYYVAASDGTVYNINVARMYNDKILNSNSHVRWRHMGPEVEVGKVLLYHNGELHFRVSILGDAGGMSFIRWYNTADSTKYCGYINDKCALPLAVPSAIGDRVYPYVNAYYSTKISVQNSAYKCIFDEDSLKKCRASNSCKTSTRLCSSGAFSGTDNYSRHVLRDYPGVIDFLDERVMSMLVHNNVLLLITAVYKDYLIARSDDGLLRMLERKPDKSAKPKKY